MDSYGKQGAPARPATNLDNNIRSQSFSTIKSNSSLQPQPEDKFDESSSNSSLSTNGKLTTCLKCKREAGIATSDPLYHCSKCSARWHRGCHNPHPPIEAESSSYWRCARCVRQYGLSSKEPPPEKESSSSICEIPGCNKPSYNSMWSNIKLDRILCKHHEMTEKNEKSRLASKAQISALSRPSSKPIKKSKLYSVKYDEDMQGMKRKPGRKPGVTKKLQMPSETRPIFQPVFDTKPAARTSGISKLENMIPERGARYPRTDNSVHVAKSTSIIQPQFRKSSPSNTKDASSVPKIQNRTIPSPSPEYEPPSPTKVDNNANVWKSDVEQDDSPGSQIKDELRAMQESAKKVVTESADALVQGSSPPSLPPSHSKKMSEPMFSFAGNKKPNVKTPLLSPEKAVEEASSTVSSTLPSSAVPMTTKVSKPLVPNFVLSNTEKDVLSPNPENGNHDAPRLAKKRKISSLQNQEVDKASTKETCFKQLTRPNPNNAMNESTISLPSQERPFELKHTSLQLQQEDSNQKDPNQNDPNQKESKHTAPLYGNYKPNTIEYRRQLRSKTYDPSVLDHFLGVQIESQARAEFEREQNRMPQLDIAVKNQIWGHIDPRIVWPKEQSESWYEAKRKEIDARGGKKANFGKLLTAQVRKERSDRGWHPNQNKDFVPKEERNGGSIFVADDGNSGEVELVIRGGKLGVMVPVVGKDGKVKAEKKFLPGDK
ncbi:hypothetical protein NHQ30_008608 [Ciborinia camelliae]|nr:hypothetical protein NHQ30_008608 [Ciborinia camelliae]